MTEQELAKKKQQAWMKVRKLAEEALKELVQANEAPMEQAQLATLVEKSVVQVKLWEWPGA